jgi:hypothetical protein
LEAQESLLDQQDPLVQQFSGLRNIPNASVHAQMLSRIPANQIAANPQLMLQMQQQFGNSHVSQVVQMARENSQQTSQQPLIQAKLTIGAPGDKYEQEADRVAAEVVQQIHAPEIRQKDKEETLQPKLMVQSKADRQMTASPELASSIQGARGSGQPLADNIREPMEQAFGADFSGVRVHADAQSDALNRSIQAKAFTTGQDIFFRQEEYDPDNRKELIAHELTHVVQQNGGGLQQKTDVIQRSVGFEFEVDEVSTHYASWMGYGSYRSLKKKNLILDHPDFFKVEADEREDGTSDMEIVTEAFPETKAGGHKLNQAMKLITRFCDQLKALNQPGNQYISASQLNAFGTPVSNRWLSPKNGGLFGQLTAKPQATAGIILGNMDRLLSDIGRAPVAGLGAVPGAEARKAIGGGYDPVNDPNNAGIPGVSNARNGAIAAMNAVGGGILNSPELRALLTLLVTYLVQGQRGVAGYAKTIANPIMARTDFATMYQQLPSAERTYFDNNRPNAWVNLVIDAAQTASGLAAINLDLPVYEGRLFNDVFMYGPSMMRAVADPRYQQDLLPELTKRQWLNGIAFEGRDYLTKVNYPASFLDRYLWKKPNELESLGSYGNKMDNAMGGPLPNAPIIELRGLQNAPYYEWYSFAMSLFRYVRLVNQGSVQDYDNTLTPNIRADLAGLAGIPQRNQARLNENLAAMADITQWQ